MSDFKSLKQQSTTSHSDLQKQLEEQSKKSYTVDPRFITFERDPKTGIGGAVIRFLPPTNGEKVPFVIVRTHSFKGPTNQWFIENCPRTLGWDQPCPVCEANEPLWNGTEAEKKLASSRNKVKYISNILVVNNPADPSTNGKVFLYSYGKMIWKLIENAMKSDELTQRAGFNPFDLWTGRNFVLRITTKDKYPNYETSEFLSAEQSDLKNDEIREKIWNSQHAITPFIAPDQFKPYEKLMARWNLVMGNKPGIATSQPSAATNQTTGFSQMSTPTFGSNKPSTPVASQPAPFDASDDSMDDLAKLLGND